MQVRLLIESLVTTFDVAGKRLLTSVDPQVSFQIEV